MASSEKTFIAISSEIHEGRLVHLRTSAGESLTDAAGIECERAIEFLYNLIHKRKRTGGVVFVTYGFARDNEFIFSTMPKELRDKLFRSYRVKNAIEELEYEIENITEDYYRFDTDTQEFQLADFELHVNNLALRDLIEVEYAGYDLELANGKMLTIRKNKKAITIYDIFGFFKPHSLYTSVARMLGESQPLLDRRSFDAAEFFEGDSEVDRLKAHAAFEVEYVRRLAVTLNQKLIDNDISLSRFHGASAIASYLLSRSKARKQYHNYRYRRQHSPDAYRALRQSVFGGRAEQFKIGTIYDVSVYDINSAYAAAASTLPILLEKPKYQTEWSDTPFSFWHVDYDFTKLGLYFGPLPNREANSFTQFKLKGSGYFWQPEVSFILEHYPECVTVGHGFASDAPRADFAKAISDLYEKRIDLKAKGDPIETVLKLALSSVYGKFAQHIGKGHYYNLFYAGYITSVTRAQLLEATYGHEKQTACFQTDAIHTTANHLPVELSERLGAYKQTTYDKITYLDNGVYQCYRKGVVVKTKTRGFRRFNFQAALAELKARRTYTALAELFMGHNLFCQNIFTNVPYLSDVAMPKTVKPIEADQFAMRAFKPSARIDLTRDYIDSDPIAIYSGRESAPYLEGRQQMVNSCIDTIEAGRV